MDDSDRLVVIARVRPLSRTEVTRKEESVVAVTGRNLTLRQSGLGSGASTQTGKHFQLDCALDQTSTQSDVFCQIEPMLQTSLDGYNTTIFTYGQSGSGKTYSMLGYDLWAMADESFQKPKALTIKDARSIQQSNVLDIATDPESVGIIPRTMEWLFNQTNPLREGGSGVKICVSYLEIHNERLVDLLNSNDPVGSYYNSPARGTSVVGPNFNVSATSKQTLDIREVNGDVFVAGLTIIEVESVAEVLEILWIGARARSVAATDLNEHSSRSHTIFQAHVEILDPDSMQGVRSKISLVDLAGSEKLRMHQIAALSQERMRELTSINKSLSSLSNCISALLQKTRAHVPYRDSKLTRLLQHSLGGNTRSAFIVTLSPSATCYEETLSTLKFANRAIKVSTQASPNRSAPADDLLSQSSSELQSCKGEIVELKKMVEYLLRKCGDANASDNLSPVDRSRIIKNMQSLISNSEQPVQQQQHTQQQHTQQQNQKQIPSTQQHEAQEEGWQRGRVSAQHSVNAGKEAVKTPRRSSSKDCTGYARTARSQPPKGRGTLDQEFPVAAVPDLLSSSSSLLYPLSAHHPPSVPMPSKASASAPVFESLPVSGPDQSGPPVTSPVDAAKGDPESENQFKVILAESVAVEKSRAESRAKGGEGDGVRGGVIAGDELSSEWLEKYHSWLLSKAQSRSNSESCGIHGIQHAPSTSTFLTSGSSDSCRSSYSNGRTSLVPTTLSPSFSGSVSPAGRDRTLDRNLDRSLDRDKEGDGDRGGEELFDRICMMEMSVLIQAEELSKAKQLFLKTNSDLHGRLRDANRENDHLRSSSSRGRRKSPIRTPMSRVRPLIAAVHSPASPPSLGQQQQEQPQPEPEQAVQSPADADLVPSNSSRPSSVLRQAYGGRVDIASLVAPNITAAITAASSTAVGGENEGSFSIPITIPTSTCIPARVNAFNMSEGRGAVPGGSGIKSYISRTYSQSSEGQSQFGRQRGIRSLGSRDSSGRGYEDRATTDTTSVTSASTPQPSSSSKGGGRDGAGFEYDVYPSLRSVEYHRVPPHSEDPSRVNSRQENGPSAAGVGNGSGERENGAAAAGVGGGSGGMRLERGRGVGDRHHSESSTDDSSTCTGGRGGEPSTSSYNNPQTPRPVPRRKTLWGEYVDPDSGLTYYHNRQTKETTWDAPTPHDMRQLMPIIRDLNCPL